MNRQLRLTLLAPDIVEAILEGRRYRAMQRQDLARAMLSAWENSPPMIKSFGLGVNRQEKSGDVVPG